jgi:hypothetical protein
MFSFSCPKLFELANDSTCEHQQPAISDLCPSRRRRNVGSIFGGPAAALLREQTGSWTAVFILVAFLDALTALLAMTLLKTMRRTHFEAAHGSAVLWAQGPRSPVSDG